jgi:hypothetical protein
MPEATRQEETTQAENQEGSIKELSESRRKFLKAAGLTTGAALLSSGNVVAESG